jgi:UDP-glucose 4-epimerase
VELTGSDRPVVYAPRSQATLVRNRIGCPKLAKDDLGFEASVDLREGIDRLIRWRRDHMAEVEARRLVGGH